MKTDPVLHFFCGKMASGKTTLSKKLASNHNAILISEDVWLSKLYPKEISSFDDYLKYSSRLKLIVSQHVQNILAQGISVVLDFPGNVPSQRQWFRSIFEAAHANHVLHYIVAPDFYRVKAVTRFWQTIPDYDDVEAEAFNTLQFFDAGTNGNAYCPNCGEAIDRDYWNAWIEEDKARSI